MSKKEMRQVYLVVKTVLLALSLVLLISGVQCIDIGDKAGSLVFCWLSGVLMCAFATLEE